MAEPDNPLEILEDMRMKLLDLTAKNKLINFRHSKTNSLRIIDELPNQLIETLLSGKEMNFLAVPEPPDNTLEDGIKPSAERWARTLELDTQYEMPVPLTDVQAEKHSDKKIQTLLYKHHLETRLKNISQKANLAINEMGANILYLAFGFLEWYEAGKNSSRLAPLFLLPVRIEKKKLNQKTMVYEYSISYSGEDIIPNLSLREKLKTDFGMVLPELDENSTPEDYFVAVQKLITGMSNWKVKRYITLTLLNFSKMLMYLDLDPKSWSEGKSILSHPIVLKFLVNQNCDEETQDSDNDLDFSEKEYDIDLIDDVHDQYPLIADADSSQHSAIIDVLKGRNLIIKGPPGTGKSQTITNLIAAALSQGKTVLFVAEKLAALEVVKDRLEKVGLGDFCLELHSHKSQKRTIIHSIESRLRKHNHYGRKPDLIHEEILQYKKLMTSLNDYADLINSKWKSTGKTIHEILMTSTHYNEALGQKARTYHPTIHNSENWDILTEAETEQQLNIFKHEFDDINKTISKFDYHPWQGIKNTDIPIFDIDQILDNLKQWQNTLIEGQQLFDNFSSKLEFSSHNLSSEIIKEIVSDLNYITNQDPHEMDLTIIPKLIGNELTKASEQIDLFESLQTKYKVISSFINEEAFDSIEIELKNIKNLNRYIRPDCTVKELNKSVVQIQDLLGRHDGLISMIKDIESFLDKKVFDQFELNLSGLEKLNIFIEFIVSLPELAIPIRSELFENSELDKELPKIRKELSKIIKLKKELQGIFKFDNLPSVKEMQEHQSNLMIYNSKMIRFFIPSWRDSKKFLRDLGLSKSLCLIMLTEELSGVIKYKRLLDKINNNKTFQRLLGNNLDGINTNLSLIEGLRNWYIDVHYEYGIGFGKDVFMGDIIINLPVDEINKIKNINNSGIKDALVDTINLLKQLKKSFSPYDKLKSKDCIVFGKDSALNELYDSLKSIIIPIVDLLDDEITIKILQDRASTIVDIKKDIRQWQNYELFGHKIDLDFKDSQCIKEENSLVKTIQFASHIAKVNFSEIKNYIYANPVINTFQILSQFLSNFEHYTNDELKNRCAFSELVLLDEAKWFSESMTTVPQMVKRNELAINNEQYLSNWMTYIWERKKIAELGYSSIITALDSETISSDQIITAFRAGIYDLMAREIFVANQELLHISGSTQEALQKSFRECDITISYLQSHVIAWKLDQRKIPKGIHGVRVKDHTELFLLKHVCNKPLARVSLRNLIKRAQKALIALKPCFMMGPMSVAQYLEPGQLEFDLLIMDEASQIRPQDALGAIARAKQIVIVGDQKQLPPTNFFKIVDDDEDEDVASLAEAESILDATSSMFKSRQLNWHYRSRHESLIAFSNSFFYDDQLIVFPSPFNECEEFGIKYVRVDTGCFTNQTNINEARTIAEAVRHHYSHNPDETLGVVAMSASQRTQIETAIEQLTKEDFAFSKLMEKSVQEPFFVKNLENVQGDERDVIYISMTYGPAEVGMRVFQRFGPINSETGWRRLNVLFTRSRKRMHVFSSMDSSDILADQSKSRGVRALRDFLKYCETGIIHRTESTGKPADSEFEVAVIKQLNDAGFECEPQVGVAGYFVDIGVKDPGNPGRYLMGVECDGATYHSAKSARDRDRLRQEILERLGWRICRIWSTDWFKNPKGELQPIIDQLNKLKTKKTEKEIT